MRISSYEHLVSSARNSSSDEYFLTRSTICLLVHEIIRCISVADDMGAYAHMIICAKLFQVATSPNNSTGAYAHMIIFTYDHELSVMQQRTCCAHFPNNSTGAYAHMIICEYGYELTSICGGSGLLSKQ